MGIQADVTSDNDDDSDGENSESESDFVSFPHKNSNKVEVGIQTSVAHFRRIERTRAFKVRELAKKESIDWATSTLFSDIVLQKGTNRATSAMHSSAKSSVEEGGN